MLKETMANMMVAKINKGSYVKEVAEFFGVSEGYAYKLLREHYPVKKGAYAKLLKTSRDNKKKRMEAQNVLCEPMSEEAKSLIQNEVAVMETGYMLAVGVEGILKETLDVYVPFFCIKELDKLSNSYNVARELMTMHWSNRQVTSINLRGKEELYVDPTYPVKDRSRGVVATCVELDSKGFKVRLLTNSREIEELAKLQECDIEVIRVAPVN